MHKTSCQYVGNPFIWLSFLQAHYLVTHTHWHTQSSVCSVRSHRTATTSCHMYFAWPIIFTAFSYSRTGAMTPLTNSHSMNLSELLSVNMSHVWGAGLIYWRANPFKTRKIAHVFHNGWTFAECTKKSFTISLRISSDLTWASGYWLHSPIQLVFLFTITLIFILAIKCFTSH